MLLYVKLLQMLTVEQNASVAISFTEVPNTSCTVCSIHWNSMPGWKQNIYLGMLFGDEGDSSCCIQG